MLVFSILVLVNYKSVINNQNYSRACFENYCSRMRKFKGWQNNFKTLIGMENAFTITNFARIRHQSSD